MSKRLFAFIALFVFVQVSFAAWNGSAKVPKTAKQNDTLFYEITSAEELVGYLESVLAEEDIYKVHAYLKNDIVFGADTSKLCEKVLDHQKQKAYFQSTFDGRGHTIYGLNAVNPLFNTIGQGDGYVINLNIVNSSFGGDTVMYAASVARENLGVIRNVNVINDMDIPVLAIDLKDQGRDVVVIEMDNEGTSYSRMHAAAGPSARELLNITKEKEIPIYYENRLAEVGDGYVLCTNTATNETVRYECDSVLSAMGMIPRMEEANSLRRSAPETDVYIIGDAKEAGTISNAVNQAFQAALHI